MIWTHGENGGGPVGEENSRIQYERCEVERKAMNGMDGRYEKSIEMQFLRDFRLKSMVVHFQSETNHNVYGTKVWCILVFQHKCMGDIIAEMVQGIRYLPHKDTIV